MSAARLRRIVLTGLDDLRGRGPAFADQPPSRHLEPGTLRGYLSDFRAKARFALAGAADERGYMSSLDGAVIPVAQTALGFWELLLDGEDVREEFLARADWLVREARPGPAGRGVAWYTDLPFAKYGLEEPWPSAMGQGEAMSVLLRAAELTGEASYRDLAVAAFAPMTVPVAEGGVTSRLDGALVLEEYPTDRPAAILNGWLFALFGLYELAAHAHPPARAVFEESRAGLLKLLPRYDVGWWSLYSLYDHGRPDLAKPFYHRLHPVLLDGLDRVAPDDRLRRTARRWEAQVTRIAVARVAVDKLVFRADREIREAVRRRRARASRR